MIWYVSHPVRGVDVAATWRNVCCAWLACSWLDMAQQAVRAGKGFAAPWLEELARKGPDATFRDDADPDLRREALERCVVDSHFCDGILLLRHGPNASPGMEAELRGFRDACPDRPSLVMACPCLAADPYGEARAIVAAIDRVDR